MVATDNAALEARVAALVRAELAARERRRARGGRARRLAAALSVALLVALVPLGLFAANPFTDLDPGQDAGHNPNIDLIYNAGITTGCSPAEYCPKEFVTREQMASFLARTAGLGPNPPVANASILRGYAPSGLARAAGAKTVSVDLDGTFTNIATATIEVPAPGYVIVTGTAGMYVPSGGGACPCEALLRLHYPAGNEFSLNYLLRSAALEGDSAAATHLFTVTTPGTRVFALQAQQVLGTKELTAGGEITALYVPFGGTGTTP
jgi:hypothetical protein